MAWAVEASGGDAVQSSPLSALAEGSARGRAQRLFVVRSGRRAEAGGERRGFSVPGGASVTRAVL